MHDSYVSRRVGLMRLVPPYNAVTLVAAKTPTLGSWFDGLSFGFAVSRSRIHSQNIRSLHRNNISTLLYPGIGAIVAGLFNEFESRLDMYSNQPDQCFQI